jgi:hypothetical protein
MYETVTHQTSSYGSLIPNTRQTIIYGRSHRRQLADRPEFVQYFVTIAINFQIFEVEQELRYQKKTSIYTI